MRLPRTLNLAGLPLGWLAAIIVLVVTAYAGYAGYVRAAEKLAERVVAATNELAPLVQQERIPRSLVAAVAERVQRPELGINYLTVRNAQGVVLVSDGRFESVAESLPAAQARQLRGLLYRVTSDDRRTTLRDDAEAVGYSDFGIDFGAILAAAPWQIGLAFALWLVAAYVTVSLTPGMVSSIQRLVGDRRSRSPASRQAAPRPAAATPPQPAAAASESQLLDHLGIGLITVDGDGRVLEANAAAGALLDTDPNVLRGRRLERQLRFVDDEGKEADTPLLRCLRGARGPLRSTLWLPLGQRGERHFGLEMVAGVAVETGGAAANMVFWDADATLRQQSQLQERANVAEIWLEHSHEAIALVDVAGRLLTCNKSWATLCGESRRQVEARDLATMVPEPFAQAAIATGQDQRGRVAASSGDPVPVRIDVFAVTWQGRDAFSIVLRPERSEAGPTVDSGTSATVASPPADWHDHLARGLEAAAAAEQRCTVAVISVVDCRAINRSHGRAAGDAVLATVGARLAELGDDHHAAAALGGNEFVLMRVGGDAGDAALDRMGGVIERVFAAPVRVDDRTIPVQADVGVAVGPDQAADADHLLACAEIALDSARAAGDRRPRLYEPGMAEAADHVDHPLYAALMRDGVVLSFRAIERTGDGTIAAAMVEPAWTHEGRTLSGRQLTEYAREHDLSAPLARWAVDALAREFAGWRDIGLSTVPLMLPADADMAGSDALAAAWRNAAVEPGMPAGALMLAFPAGNAAAHPPEGIRRALESDFSTGRPGEASALLLAPSLLSGLPGDGEAADAAKALAGYGHTHGRPVIAGPVQNDEQREALSAAGIQLLYGPALGKALPARAFGRLLARRGVQAI